MVFLFFFFFFFFVLEPIIIAKSKIFMVPAIYKLGTFCLNVGDYSNLISTFIRRKGCRQSELSQINKVMRFILFIKALKTVAAVMRKPNLAFDCVEFLCYSYASLDRNGQRRVAVIVSAPSKAGVFAVH